MSEVDRTGWQEEAETITKSDTGTVSSSTSDAEGEPNQQVDSAEDELRILRVSADIYPEVSGGLGLHVHHLSRDQTLMGHEVVVLTSDHGNSRLPEQETQAGYTIVRKRELVSPVDNSICPGFVRFLWNRADEFDVIHAHSHLFFSSNIAAIIRQITDTPLILTNHGITSQTASDVLERLYNPTIGRYTFNAANRVFCYTEKEAEMLRDRGVTTPISVVKNGIDCTAFRPRSDVERENRVLFVGRLKQGKRPERAIEAFGELRETHPELELTMVGGGPLRADLEAKVEQMGIADAVTFTGDVEYERMPEFYNRARLLLFPTATEAGNPRVILESLASHTPVVATDLPQIESKIKDHIHSVDTEADGEMEAAARTVLRGDGDMSGEAAREMVEAEYSWKSTSDKVAEVYQSVIEGTE